MSDTWTEIQEHKRRQESLRDRLQRRRRERQGIGVQDIDLSGLQPHSFRSRDVNTYALLTKREVKMAGYWPSSFLHFWSMKDFIMWPKDYAKKEFRFCGTNAGNPEWAR